MVKKYYAVRIGKNPGIYHSWEDAEKEVSGYPKAVYQSFKKLSDAEIFINQGNNIDNQVNTTETPNKSSSQGTLVAYVDGSFEKSSQRYSFGAVLIKDEQIIEKLTRVGNNPKYQGSWQIAGEVFGALHAIQWAIKNHFNKIIIHYDYLGIEKWALGEWRTNKPVSTDYAKSFQKLASKIDVEFVKVKAHSGIEYNEMADQLAKDALKNTPTN